MATENQRVVAYLSHDEMAELKALSELWGLSLSKTIARAVREVGTLRADSIATVSHSASGVTESTVRALIDSKVDTLKSEMGKLAETMEGLTARLSKTEENLAIARDTQAKLIPVVNGNTARIAELKEPIDLSAIEARLDALESGSGVALEPLPTDDSEGWTSPQLARRLNKAGAGAINAKRTKPEFAEWTAKKDPQGIAWESRGEGTKARLFPIIP